MDTFSPFAIPASPAIGSMPPPSFAPPSLPPPLTNERSNETPPHHHGSNSSNSHHQSSSSHNNNPTTSSGNHGEYKPPSLSGPANSTSLASQISFTASMLTLPTPMTQGPGTPLNLGSATADSHLQPTLQYVLFQRFFPLLDNNFSKFYLKKHSEHS